jgi:hypothetical protein
MDTSVKAEMAKIIDEYLISGDALEVARRVRALPLAPGSEAARSRGALSAALAVRAAAVGASRGDEATERVASLLVQLALCGVVSAGGLAAGLRVAAARLPDARLDVGAAADERLGALFAVLVQSGVLLPGALDERALPAGALADALAEAGAAGEGAGGGAAGLAAVARAAAALLASPTPTPLAQLRRTYATLIGAYIFSGGGGLEALLEALASHVGALWSRHELARAVVLAFVAGEGGPPGTPRWVVRATAADVLFELVVSEDLDSSAVAAAFESVLIDAAELAEPGDDVPGVLAAAIALAVLDGVLPPAWVGGKHASLGGAEFRAPAPPAAGASAAPERTPALGPLPGRGADALDALDALSLGAPASPPSSPGGRAADAASSPAPSALAHAALSAAAALLAAPGDAARAVAATPALAGAPAGGAAPVAEARARARAAGAALARGDDAAAAAALDALAASWGSGARGGGALAGEAVHAALRAVGAKGWVEADAAVAARAVAAAVAAGALAKSAPGAALARLLADLDAADADPAAVGAALGRVVRDLRAAGALAAAPLQGSALADAVEARAARA